MNEFEIALSILRDVFGDIEILEDTINGDSN